MSPIQEKFARDGYEVLQPFLGEAECAFLTSHINDWRGSEEWEKGRAADDPVFYALGMRSVLLNRIKAYIGDDVMLFGANVVRRSPGQAHPWHTDIDSWDPAGGFVSVWVGISNTSRATALHVIPGSHRIGHSIQEKAQAAALPRNERNAAIALDLARQTLPDAELLEPELRNGDAILFDGRLWHGSNNTTDADTRVAILLQYAHASKKVRIPDYAQLDWPFRLLAEPLPPVIVVAGSASPDGNRFLSPPLASTMNNPVSPISVRPIDLPLEQDEKRGWKPHPLFRKATPIVADMACHVSILDPGCSPHNPQSHPEEEIMVILDGEARLLVGSPVEEECEEHTAIRGHVAYYPAFHHHTIRNRADRPVTYLMFKWKDAGVLERATNTGITMAQTAGALARAPSRPLDTKTEFERPTDWLEMLHCHTSVLQPGQGFAPHVDAHDVAIVVMEGAIEVNGKRVEPFGVAYHCAGVAHGIHNPENKSARYLVFEFHHRDKALARIAELKPVARRSRVVRFLARMVRRR